ncbi:ABC transporter permease [Amycolatopsis nigrescens]|uniref:ABC transporter permease n=1 Tax=Amycolatopsis nigrescens TaxID=381445 RepID=UPI001FDF23F6|nr:ABC transporter permease [Amycolatopsis nigrescens]
MTSATSVTSGPATHPPQGRTRQALAKMTLVETKLFLRDPGAPIVVIGIPLALLLVFGMMPDAKQPSAEFGGHSALDSLIAPMAIAILLAMLAMTMFPTAIASHREKGVLRRLAASPVSPSRLLTAQLLVNLTAAVLLVLLIVGVGTLALGLSVPKNLGGFAVSIVLGVAALFAVGLLIAALAPTGRAASGIGSVAFFPMLALGGVWVPKEKLPDFLQTAADVLPLGATLNSLRETWVGNSPQVLQLIAMAVCTVLCTVLAAKLFRWE